MSKIGNLGTGAIPASNFMEGYFSCIWWSTLITGSLLWERWSVLHNTAVTRQLTPKWPHIVNPVFRIVQTYG